MDADEVAEECLRCAGHLSWIDSAWACPSGCTYCPDCRDELGGACANCSGMLSRVQRTKRIERIRKPAGKASPSVESGGDPLQSSSSEPFK